MNKIQTPRSMQINKYYKKQTLPSLANKVGKQMDKRDKHYDILNTHSPNISQVTKHVSIVTGAGVLGLSVPYPHFRIRRG